ncbi:MULTISPECIES: septation ring formation regulator EzrA [unclassified Fictibacillus]|uniref:septation ring formation regulator EzrA n=1 Tax=unclassified Fictibacillus TaxID=2644029 RepID=UPI0006A7C5D5|nr:MULTISPECIES: septation ring formation regulator EzrA [unclassified Fictibacillus]MED2971480.1 septation ring formation regulator EzrA [Fictibacillus sp. B-59209]UZJ80284.1 septation ring formation regulator EzrA [Fictibacillus sp. KU28468]SFD58278.1 septation ring formation regulator [Bacillus sp. OV194]
MTYIIAAVVVLIAVVVFGSFSRKRIYKQIDRLESWKMDIMNRPLTEEISKVKGLTMVGETEEKFESWRSDWDEMVTVELPNMEEALFDAEESADKYRFGKAKGILHHIESRMQAMEERIKAISAEIDELITSEELNREDIIEAKEQFSEAKKYFLTHSRSLGKTAVLFEEEFTEVNAKFVQFDELTSQGNHLEARKILVESIEKLKEARSKMESVPELLVMLLSDLPSSLKDLQDGFFDMEQQGYVLNHIGIDKEITAMNETITKLLEKVYALEIDETQKGIEQLNAEIDQLYDLLENEVVSKQFVIKEKEVILQSLSDLQLDMEKIRAEADMVALSYQLDHSDVEVHKRLEKLFTKLQTRFSIIEQSIEEKKDSYSVIREMMEEMAVQLEDVKKSNHEYQEKLISLRKDELQTKERLKELRRKLLEARRMVQKSNLPGLPDHYLVTIEKAESYIIEVSKRLDDKPLEIADVTEVLEKALEAVEEGYRETAEIIETALLAEKLIQYGNRYRSSYSSVSVRLIEAEIAFRNYQYEEALTIAGTAIESVQPGILKEMEINLKQKI